MGRTQVFSVGIESVDVAGKGKGEFGGKVYNIGIFSFNGT